MARHAKKIDYTHWTGNRATFGGFSAGVVAATMFPAIHEPEILLRLRGELVAYLDAVQAPGSLVDVAVGLILVPEGTGATVLWSPIADSDAPWVWYARMSIGYEEMVTDVVQAAALSGMREKIDNKAMRIIRNQELQLVAENVTIFTVAAVNISVNVRGFNGT